MQKINFKELEDKTIGELRGIEYYESLIKMMREDEKVFGLVREDREKIYEWQKEIGRLKRKLKGGNEYDRRKIS